MHRFLNHPREKAGEPLNMGENGHRCKYLLGENHCLAQKLCQGGIPVESWESYLLKIAFS